MPQHNWSKFFEMVGERVFTGNKNHCKHDFQISQQVCKELQGNWTLIHNDVMNFGGYCDCEVVFNAAEQIPGDRRLPQFDLDTGDLLYLEDNR